MVHRASHTCTHPTPTLRPIGAGLLREAEYGLQYQSTGRPRAHIAPTVPPVAEVHVDAAAQLAAVRGAGQPARRRPANRWAPESDGVGLQQPQPGRTVPPMCLGNAQNSSPHPVEGCVVHGPLGCSPSGVLQAGGAPAEGADGSGVFPRAPTAPSVPKGRRIGRRSTHARGRAVGERSGINGDDTSTRLPRGAGNKSFVRTVA